MIKKINATLKEYAGIMQLLTPIIVVVLGWLVMSHSHGQIESVRNDIAVMSREIVTLNREAAATKGQIETLNRNVGLIADAMDAVVRFSEMTTTTIGVHLEQQHGLEVEMPELPEGREVDR